MATPWQSLPFTKKELHVDYIVNGMLQREIGFKYSISQKVVWRAMKNMEIKARPRNSFAFYDQRLHKNHRWKGSAASYFTLHQRLRRHRGQPNHCEICGEKGPGRKYEWANLTGKFDDFSDYKRMCISCHSKHDKIYYNFKKVYP